MDIVTSGLEHWSEFRHTGHRYNISPPLPSVYYDIRSFILFAVLFPLYTCIPAIDESYKRIIQLLRSVGKSVIYLNFIPSRIVIIGMNVLVILFWTAILWILFESKTNLFKNCYSFSARLIFEILTPILTIYSFTLFQKSLSEYLRSITSFQYLTISSVNLLLFFGLYVTSLSISAHSLQVSFKTYSAWNSWVQFFYAIFPLIFFQLQTLADLDVKYRGIWVSGPMILVNFIILIDQRKLSFINGITGFIITFYSVEGIFINIHNILMINLPSIFTHNSFTIILILSVISLSISYVIYSKTSSKIINKKMKNLNINLIELADLDSSNIEFPIELANDKSVISFLHSLTINDQYTAKRLAHFILDRTDNPSIMLETLRMLVIIGEASAKDVETITELNIRTIPFQYKQLACDLQYEAVGKETEEEDEMPFLNQLTKMKNSIKALLIEFVDNVSMDDQAEFETTVRTYVSRCKEFETLSALYLVRSPSSYLIMQSVADYYSQLRGDIEMAQLWKARASSIESGKTVPFMSVHALGGFGASARLRMHRSDSGNIIRSIEKSADSGLAAFSQKTSMQHVMNHVRSCAVGGAIPCLICLLILALLSAFFRYDRKLSSETAEKLSKIILHPLWVVRNVTSNALEICDPESYEGLTEYVFQNMIKLLDFEGCITEKVDDAWGEIAKLTGRAASEDVNITVVPQDPIPSFGNYSMKFVMMQMVTMIHSISYSVKCTEEIHTNFFSFYNRYRAILSPLNRMHFNIQKLTAGLIALNDNRFIVFVAIIVGITIADSVLIYYFIVERKRREVSNFWNTFLEIDPKQLEQFRNDMLSNAQPLDDNSAATSGSMNVLDSDEIEGGEENCHNIAIDIYTELNSSEKMGRVIKWKSSPTNDLPFIIYTIVYCILFALVLSITIYPRSKTLENMREIDRMHGMLVSALAGSAQAAMDVPMYVFDKIFGHSHTIEYEPQYLLVQELISNASASNSKYYQSIIPKIAQISKTIFEERDLFFSNQTKDISKEVMEKFFMFAFRNITNLSNELLSEHSERLSKNKIVDVWTTHLAATLLIAIGTTFAIIFGYRIADYWSVFNGLKWLTLLPVSGGNTISQLLELFYPKQFRRSQRDAQLSFQSRYIIKQSVNSIIVIDKALHILDLNKATVELMGFKKELLIRESIAAFFVNPKDKSGYEQQYYDFFSRLNFLEAMTANEIAQSGEQCYNLLVRRVDSSLVPVSVKLIPIQGDGNDQEEKKDEPAYAILIQDRSEYVAQEKLFKEAQARVETLLGRILPRQMAMKLLSNNPNLFSSVDQATIIFIGIADFSSWCQGRSHLDIMQTLDVIFSKFDSKIARFPTLVKIKVINGVYMAAGGIFDDGAGGSHQLEAVQFSIACGRWLIKRNKKARTDFHLNIGINTDGPIFAGVLGIDKPLFDIWGDAVNVAARLETSARLDQIQMSMGTASAIPEGMYDVYERDGVFLKGKGYITSYCIDIQPTGILIEKSPK